MIEINNLTKIYNKKESSMVVAIDDISLRINDGELISIVGQTGSGKTTLLKLILGVLKPTSGNIIFNKDLVISKKSGKKKFRKITNECVSSFQFPDHQLFKKTVREEVLFPSNNEKDFQSVIDKLGIKESMLEESPFTLSSGEKRKVILASLLLQKPKSILFDEPTAFLDQKTSIEFLKIIKKINEEFKTTIVVISHNLKELANLTDRTILLKNGKIISDGETKKILSEYGGDYYR